MTSWFRSYWGEEDIWFYCEVDDEGWVARQIELQGPHRHPIAAASSAEWEAAFQAGSSGRYEAAYGFTAERPVTEWEGHDPQPLTRAEFQAVWAEARRALTAGHSGTPSSTTP
ncbi:MULTISPECIES: hypothetical protein [Actinomadura]|uniref:Uncharacterized protein n=1 Tax=Actinomadura yumaensis TaxID=111807 RepID=A0ABW2CKU7_9ACTN|nr:hypothetical protein [Actinomadura sp. J1-007]MWK38534.1 hypothetical protein [Actinomadura sp. J1-007]